MDPFILIIIAAVAVIAANLASAASGDTAEWNRFGTPEAQGSREDVA